MCEWETILVLNLNWLFIPMHIVLRVVFILDMIRRKMNGPLS